MPDALVAFAGDLAKAWKRYSDAFGEPPHGTQKQLAAMLELLPAKTREQLAWAPYIDQRVMDELQKSALRITAIQFPDIEDFPKHVRVILGKVA